MLEEWGDWRHIYLLGIGGVGMGGLAEVLLQRGYRVSGSDLNHNHVVDQLIARGVKVDIGHDSSVLCDVDVVVCSSAICVDNPIVVQAKERGVSILRRAEMLALLLRGRRTIAIAGTHGKTTTSGLTATVLLSAGLSPSFFVGGHVAELGALACDGEGDYAVVEADESDASLLCLSPELAIVTNIDQDHLENFPGGFIELKQAFVQFLAKLPAHGLAIVCCDSDGVVSILPEVSSKVVTYGFSAQAQVRIVHYRQIGLCAEVGVRFADEAEDVVFSLNLPGRHNALNAVAALIVARELGVLAQALQVLATFSGVDRRFVLYGAMSLVAGGKAWLLEDYGHHPKELEVTLAAVRSAWPSHRVVWVFQPHRFSRTRLLFQEFCRVLAQVDVLILLPVYGSGESWQEGADSESLLRSMQQERSIEHSYLASDSVSLRSLLAEVLQDGDILLMQGAGDIGEIALSLAESCVAG